MVPSTEDNRGFGPPAKFEAEVGEPIMGTIIIRTWIESHHPQGFRARIISSLSMTAEEHTVATAGPNEVLEIVREWMAAQSAGLSDK
jgi:hypothetical protein